MGNGYKPTDSQIARMGPLANDRIAMEVTRVKRLRDRRHHDGRNGYNHKPSKMEMRRRRFGPPDTYSRFVRQVKHGAYLQGEIVPGLIGSRGSGTETTPDETTPKYQKTDTIDRELLERGGRSGTNLGIVLEQFYFFENITPESFDEASTEYLKSLGYNPALLGRLNNRQYREAACWLIMNDDALEGRVVGGGAVRVTLRPETSPLSSSDHVELTVESLDYASAAYLARLGYGMLLLGLSEPERHKECNQELLSVLRRDPAFKGVMHEGVLRVSLRPEYGGPIEVPLPEDDNLDLALLAADNVDLAGNTHIEELLGLHVEEPAGEDD